MLAYPFTILGGIWIYIKSIIDYKEKKDKEKDV